MQAEETIKKNLGRSNENLVNVGIVDQTTTNANANGTSSTAGTVASDSRLNLESSAGMSDRMSSCNSDYAPSSNSGNSSSGAFTD